MKLATQPNTTTSAGQLGLRSTKSNALFATVLIFTAMLFTESSHAQQTAPDSQTRRDFQDHYTSTGAAPEEQHSYTADDRTKNLLMHQPHYSSLPQPVTRRTIFISSPEMQVNSSGRHTLVYDKSYAARRYETNRQTPFSQPNHFMTSPPQNQEDEQSAPASPTPSETAELWSLPFRPMPRVTQPVADANENPTPSKQDEEDVDEDYVPVLLETLEVIVWTDDDDLRGGNDNAKVRVSILEGHTFSYVEKSLNDGERLKDHSVKKIQIDVGGVSLWFLNSLKIVTNFTGGIDGDNWNINRIKVYAIMSDGTKLVISDQSGKPLTRIDNHNREYRVRLSK